MANPQQDLLALNRANVETTLSLAAAVLKGAERLATLQISAAKELLADNAKIARNLMSVKDAGELISMKPVAEPLLERALSYSRSVYEVTTETQAEITRLLEARLKEIGETVNEAVTQAAKNAPVGSDVAVAAVRSAMAAASSAYENMQKITGQVKQLTEANVAAASEIAKPASRRKSASKA
jgi:phasin family protein